MTILSIGLSCLDQFFFVNQYPTQNHKAYASDLIESGGGPCGNASYLLGKWGEEVYHLTSLKQGDLTTAKLRQELELVGVNCEYSLIDEKQITPIAAIFINSSNASRTIVTYRNSQPKPLSSDYLQKLDQFIAQLNEQAEPVIVLVDGHEFEIADYVLARLKHKLVVMDAGNYKEGIVNLAKYVNYFVSSEDFALALIKSKETNLAEADYVKALTALSEISHEQNQALITLGEKGTIYLKDNQLVQIPAYPCKPVDTTGAGDTYHGAFTYGLKQGWDLERIIKFSSLTAAMMIEKKGVREAIPTLTEVEHSFTAREKPN